MEPIEFNTSNPAHRLLGDRIKVVGEEMIAAQRAFKAAKETMDSKRMRSQQLRAEFDELTVALHVLERNL